MMSQRSAPLAPECLCVDFILGQVTNRVGHKRQGIMDVQLCFIFVAFSIQRKKPANAQVPRSCAAARPLLFLTIPYDYCGVWIRNIPHRLMNPYTYFQQVVLCEEVIETLEGVQHSGWALRVYNLHLFPVLSLCTRRNVISLLPVPVSMPSLPTVSVCPSGTTN